MQNEPNEQAKIEAEKELALKDLELKAKDQASTSRAATPPPRKSKKLPVFMVEKDERYAENAFWEKNTCSIKLSALLT